jgi:hypothetical protein
VLQLFGDRAVEVKSSAKFEGGVPKALFETRLGGRCIFWCIFVRSLPIRHAETQMGSKRKLVEVIWHRMKRCFNNSFVSRSGCQAHSSDWNSWQNAWQSAPHGMVAGF